MNVPPRITIEGVLSILTHAVCAKCIPNILAEVQSKSAQARARIAEYVSIITDSYPDDVLERYIDPICKTLKKSLADANPDARNYSRSALTSICDKFPQEGQKLMASLDPTTRKQIAGVMNSENAGENHSPISRSSKLPPSRKTTQGGRDQSSTHEEEDIMTEDTSKTAYSRTPNSKTHKRTPSAVKRSTGVKDDDTPTGKTGQREERKKSVAKTKVRERSSMKSVEPASRDLDAKTTMKSGKTRVGSSSSLSIDIKDIVAKLDHVVVESK